MDRQEEFLVEEGEEVGARRAEGLSATGDRGQAAASLMSDTDGTHVHIFVSLQLKGSYVGDLLYPSSALTPLIGHFI